MNKFKKKTVPYYVEGQGIFYHRKKTKNYYRKLIEQPPKKIQVRGTKTFKRFVNYITKK